MAQEEYDEALAQAREQIVLLQKKESRYYYAIGLRNLGMVLWKKGDRAGSSNAFSTALVDLKDQLHIFEYAVGLRYWGEALADWGEDEESIKKLTEAKGLFQGMEAEGELLKVEEALQLIG